MLETFPRLLAMLLLMTVAGVLAGSSLRHLAEGNYTHGDPNPPSLCYIENGFDYEGNDIANAPSTPVEGCCDACIKTRGCQAWSWSSYNNGTCWLKSARGRIIANANVKSSLLLHESNITCSILEDVDFIGEDIGHVASANVGGCCSACQSTLGCRAYSWSNYQGGTCWLKSSRGISVVAPGVKSAEAYPLAHPWSPVCILEYDIDYVDNDIGSAPSASPMGCCSICLQTFTCHGYSWTNHNGGTCWLKNVVGDRIKKPGVVSSAVFPNEQNSCNVQQGIDFVGSDLKSVRNSNPDLCCLSCYMNVACRAYTWSDFNGGTCWLKSGTGTPTSNPNTLSGTRVVF